MKQNFIFNIADMRITALLMLFSFLGTALSSQSYPMDGTPITDCSGFFSDSGGGNADYSPNENFTTTICSDNTTGTHIQLVFSGINLGAGDALCFFDGPDATAPPLSCAADFTPGAPFIIQATAANVTGCLTITFNSDAAGESPGWSADINCIPSCQTILSELISTTPIVEPADTGYIDICPGDRVFLSARGIYPQDGIIYNHSDLTSSFTWDFGEGGSAVGPNTSHVYNEPGGYVIQLKIEDQFGCKNTNFISQRVRVATYPDFELAEDISNEICVGDTVSFQAFVSNIDTAFDVSVTPTVGTFQTQGVRSDSLPLPDGTGATYQTSIAFADFSPGQVLTNIADLVGICVNMEHSWMHDLEITLSCPNGTTVVLQDQVFQGGVFLGEPDESDEGMDPPLQGVGYDYCWTPDATNGNWTAYWQANGGQTLPAGDYNSFESLDNFLGCPLNGEWTLTVQDLWAIDNGWIFEWSIGFDPALYPNIETFQPNIIDFGWNNNNSVVYYEPDSIVVSPANAGAPLYTFTVTDDFGCSNDTTVVLNVLPETHPDCHQCSDNLTAQQDTTICAGDEIQLIGTPTTPPEELAVTFEGFINQPFDQNVASPGNPFEAVLNVSFINPPTIIDATVQIASVCVNIEHVFDDDIELRLRAPDGTLFELSTDNGGGGDGYLNTCFTPSAITPITAGVAPFTGDFQPEGNWADLNGVPTTGAWTLLVADDQNGFGGTILDWSITFNNENDLSYGWTPATGLDCVTCPDPMASPMVTTEYILNAVDFYGCPDTDTLIVTVIDALTAPVLNCGPQQNGELTIEWLPIPGVSQFEVSLDGGGTWIPASAALSHTVTGLNSGDFVTIIVRGIAANVNCPPLESTITCQYSSCVLAIDTSATVAPSCWNTNDGLVFMSAMNAQSPVVYSLDGGVGQGPNISDVSAGFHYVIATDGSGCRDSIGFTMPSPAIITIATTVDSVTCNGACDGAAQAIAGGGANGFTYVWNTIPATFGANATNLCPGIYSVTASDANGCAIADTIEIFEPTLLTSINTETAITCNGANDGSATVMPSGGTPAYTYLWDNAQVTDTATGLSPGNHDVTITDLNGCVIIETVNITEPDPLVLTMDSIDASCNGVADGFAICVAVGGTGFGYQYVWVYDGNVVTGATTPPVPGGTYCVTVTDDNGCTAEDCIIVNQPDSISLMLSATPSLCAGVANGTATVTASGGAGNFTYLWDNNQVNTTANLLSEGLHFVTVTDVNGCEKIGEVTVPSANPIVLQMDSTATSCVSATDGVATVIAVGGAGNFTYLWDDAGAQTANIAVGLTIGNYCVTVTDGNGCTAVDCVEITTPDPLVIDAIIETPTNCYGEANGSAIVTVSGGTGAGTYSYAWNDPSAQMLNPATGLEANNYEVTVTDGNGCFVIGTIEVTQPDTLTVATNFQSIACFGGTDGTATALPNGGVMPYTYAWNDISNQTDPTAVDLPAGLVTVTVTDDNNCTATAVVDIDQPTTAVTAAISQTFIGCNDAEQSTAEIIPAGGAGNYTYLWSNNQVTSTASNLDAINYAVTVTDGSGCTFVENINITELNPINATISANDPTCFQDVDGTAEVITVTGGAGNNQISDYTYLWNSGAGNAQAIGLTGNATYEVTITDNQGCTGLEMVTLGEPTQIIVTTGEEAVSCFAGSDGTALILDIQGDNNHYTYEWGANAGNQITQDVADLPAGNYGVTVTDDDGCTASAQAIISQPDAMAIEFVSTDNSCSGYSDGTLEAKVTGGTPDYEYRWGSGSTESFRDELAAGNYPITITDANDCVLMEMGLVEGPESLQADIQVKDVTCFGDRDGSMTINLTGGTPPYQYSLDGETYGGATTQVGLTAGDYTIYLLDNENCEWSQDFTVAGPEEFIVDAGPDEVVIELGDSIRLTPSAENNFGAVQYSWYAPYPGTLSCYPEPDTIECRSPQSITLNTITYELYAVDENGCESMDDITVRVEKPRSVYVPTGFSPNGDASNDLLRVHGKEGTLVEIFRVFDRWGNLVYEGGNFMVNDENAGWTGYFKGEKMNPGVYVWYLEAVYIDGFREIFKGNTTLIR